MAKKIQVVLVAAFLCLPAQANGAIASCPPRDALIATLGQKHGEAPVAGGPTNAGGLIQVFATPHGAGKDTWSLVLHLPNGTSCLIAAGEGWRAIEPVASGPKT